MKQRGMQVLMIAAAVLVIGWLGLGRGGGDFAAAESLPAAPANTVTVAANGSVMVEPDVAYLYMAVETRGAKATDAQKGNADKFAAVEKTLYDTFGIEKKDVKTTGFRVQPEYNYTEKEGQVLKGYIAVHSIQVTYRKLPDIGKLLDALSAAGVNRMGGVQFNTEKKEQYELDALKKAMANASAKANVLAASANRQLKGVLNIVQGDVTNRPIFANDMMEAKMKSMDMATGSASSLQSGEIEISTSVTVQYDMK